MILEHNIDLPFFYTSNSQKTIAENVIQRVDVSKHWNQKVVTEIIAFDKFLSC